MTLEHRIPRKRLLGWLDLGYGDNGDNGYNGDDGDDDDGDGDGD